MRRTMLPLALVLLLLAGGCQRVGPPVVQYFPVPARAGQSQWPFSSAVRVGDMLFLAGQIGTDSTGSVVPGGIEAETRQTWRTSAPHSRALVRRWTVS